MNDAATLQDLAHHWTNTHVLAPFTSIEYAILSHNEDWLEVVSEAIDAVTAPTEEDALFYMADLNWTWDADRAAFIQRDEDGCEIDADTESTTWLELADSEGELAFIDTTEPEVLEWWIVSDRAFTALEKAGEVTLEFYDLNIWGRQTSGQAIHLDGVIQRIALRTQ